MNRNRPASKIMAWILTFAMMITILPITVGAQGAPPLGASGEIVAFDVLDDEILWQGCDAGDAESAAALKFPDTLTGRDTGGSSVTVTGVTWKSTPAFDPDVEIAYPGYRLQAVLPEDYALADGVAAPVITVFVRPAGGMLFTPTSISVWDGTNATAADGDSIDISGASSSGGTLTVPTGATVTITGTVTGLAGPLTIDIADGATVKWQAELSGSSNSGLVFLPGNGIFEVVTGGKIEQNGNGWAIDAYGEDSTVTVKGTGKVLATGDDGYAIQTLGSVSVEDNAEVSATTGWAIVADSANSTVTVKGTGKVQATGDGGYAIFTQGSVVVEDNAEVSATTGRAINAEGENSTVTVSGGAVTNSATSGLDPVIYMNSSPADTTIVNVTVKGTGKVLATEDGGWAIRTEGSVSVEDNAEVSATTGWAIYASGENGTVTVSGGVVSATTGMAINAHGENSTVTVSGGVVTNSATINSYPAIYVTSIPADTTIVNVTVKGTGKVLATGDGDSNAIRTRGSVSVEDNAEVSSTGDYAASSAIYASGENSTVTVSGGAVSATTGYAIWANGENITVTVSGGVVSSVTGTAIFAYGANSTVTVSGGVVSATIRYAINATGENSTVEVSGGLVFAYGSDIAGQYNVILLYANPSGFTGATGTGVVIAWGGRPGAAYIAETSADIAVNPSSATAKWANSGSEAGISYANGANAGFIPLDVTIIPESVAVGTQIGALVAGTAGSVTYAVTTTGIPDGSYTAAVANLPAGVAASEPVSISGGTGVLTLTGNASTAEGTASNLILTIKNTDSAAFSLTILPAGTEIYDVTVNGSYAAASGAGKYAQGQSVTIYAGTRDNYRFTGWSVDDGGITLSNASNTTTDFTMPANAVTVTASWVYTGGGTAVNSDTGSGDSGSGGGGSASTSTTATPSTQWLESNPAGILANGANGQNLGYVRTKSIGMYGVRAAAWKKLAGLEYRHDTMDGNSVQVRVYIGDPAKFTKDTLVSGWVKGTEVGKVKAFFEKWFKNKVRVIHLDQKADWGQPVEIAAKVDLTGMDTKNLYFYSYDKATNSYRRIEKPAYWIDSNGYLHFTTPYAGDIVVSEGELERK